MSTMYILDENNNPVVCTDTLRWGRWFENADRSVRKTEAFGCLVSTVFLGLDHRYDKGPPLIFETMIFGPDEHPLNEYQTRCSTWDEAVHQHSVALRELMRHENKDEKKAANE
jgi:hypothetical protein